MSDTASSGGAPVETKLSGLLRKLTVRADSMIMEKTTALSISERVAFLESEMRFEEDDLIEFDFIFPDTDGEAGTIVGQVIRMDDDPQGIAVRIRRVVLGDTIITERYEKFIEELRAAK